MIINTLQYLERAGERYPDKAAFVDKNSRVSFDELMRVSKAVGSCILDRYDETKKPVLVLTDRSAACIAAFFGVLYSGNFYAAIDRATPIKRLKRVLDSMKPKVALVFCRDADVLKEVGFDGETLIIEEAMQADINERAIGAVRAKAMSTDPLYALFTSGSTGVPKAVLNDHRSIIEGTENFIERFGFSEKTVLANQAAFSFDLAAKDIYFTIGNAATTYIIPKKLFAFPARLIDFLNENKVNTVIWATYLMRVIENLKGLNKQLPMYLETIFFTAEVMPNKVLNYWRSKLPNVRYINLYGPTEVAFNALYYIVDREFEDSEILPMGETFPNSDVFLLKEDKWVLRANEVGEICIRGNTLGIGYYKNPEKTAQAYCQNPLNPNYPERIYRTGTWASTTGAASCCF